MPFYRLKVGIVHVKGTKLPEPCGARVLIDSREVLCLAPSGFLCDGQDNRNHSGTCDRPVCEAHVNQVGPNRHLCPACFRSNADAQQQRSLFTSLVQP